MTMPMLPAVFLLYLTDATASINERGDYTRYHKYPPYCSSPEEMKRRTIPPLKVNIEDGQSEQEMLQLVHVTALIRHGARAPWEGPPTYKCWNGYWDNPETGVWNCDLKTYIAPPAVVNDDESTTHQWDVLYEKSYDALTLSSTENNKLVFVGNDLDGTCQVGQLLLQGYHQQIQNGLFLRQAYLYDGNTSDSSASAHPSMRLWDFTSTEDQKYAFSTERAVVVGDATKKAHQEPNLYFRSDDEQRTIISGQILLRGLFGPELQASSNSETNIIRLHTADDDKDILVANSQSCPKVRDLIYEAYNSQEFKQWNETSAEVQMVRQFVQEKLGLREIPRSILDCMMTTICTDRPLPEPINDYDGSLRPTPWNVESTDGSATVSENDFSHMFERIMNYAVKQETFLFKYNNASISKLGMIPLWKEIMANILPIVDSNNSYPFAKKIPPKFALFSGHDTTLMPILATLGENVWSGLDWTPYAGMFLIEIYEIKSDVGSKYPSGHAFRIIYNGNVLTSKMDECSSDSELCDSEVLVKHIMSFVLQGESNCTSTNAVLSNVSVEAHEQPNQELMTTNKGTPDQAFEIAFISALMGSFLTFLFTRSRNRNAYDHRASSVLRELSMVDESEVVSHYRHTGAPLRVSHNCSNDRTELDENSII